MTRTGDREIRSVPGRLPDNPGELACMQSTANSNSFKIAQKTAFEVKGRL